MWDPYRTRWCNCLIAFFSSLQGVLLSVSQAGAHKHSPAIPSISLNVTVLCCVIGLTQSLSLLLIGFSQYEWPRWQPMGPKQGEKGEWESKQHISGVRDTQGSLCWEFQVMFLVWVPRRPKGVWNCNWVTQWLIINLCNPQDFNYLHTKFDVETYETIHMV